MNKKIIKNKIMCLNCMDIIESKHVHDFKWCSCGAVAVDGGKEYLRRCSKDFDGSTVPFKDMSILEHVKLNITEVFKCDTETCFRIEKLAEEVILIKFEGVKQLRDRNTGRLISLTSEYIDAEYTLLY